MSRQKRLRLSRKQMRQIEQNQAISIIVKNFLGVNWHEKLKVFPVFTIYSSPTDFPGKFVVRLFDGPKPLRLITISDTLEDARRTIPQGPPLGFVRTERHPNDDPVIVESWI